MILFIFLRWQLFSGNDNDNTVKVHVLLLDTIFARYVRINPQTWHHDLCLRTELYGCKWNPNGSEQFVVTWSFLLELATMFKRFRNTNRKLKMVFMKLKDVSATWNCLFVSITSNTPVVVVDLKLATFRLEYEDDYVYEFTVLSMRFSLAGRKVLKCTCSELCPRTRSRPRVLQSEGRLYR